MYKKQGFREFFLIIKTEPNKYLLENKINYLAQFLIGLPKEFFLEEDQIIFEIFKDKIWEYSKEYIYKYGDIQKMKDTVIWSEQILSVSQNEDEAMNTFFKILDNFIEDYYKGFFTTNSKL